MVVTVVWIFIKEKKALGDTKAQLLTAANVNYATVTAMLLMASSYFEGFKSLSTVIFSDKRKYFQDLLTHSSLKHRKSMYLMTLHPDHLPFLPPDQAGQLLSLEVCGDSVHRCGLKGHPSVLLQSPASSQTAFCPHQGCIQAKRGSKPETIPLCFDTAWDALAYGYGAVRSELSENPNAPC